MSQDWQEKYRREQAKKEEECSTPQGCPGRQEAPEPEEEGCEGACSSCSEGATCPSAQEAQQLEQQMRLELTAADFKHELLVLSGKGGVGKSTVAANLAWALALHENSEIGLLDADLHGPTIPLMMGLQGERVQSVGEKILPVPVMSTLKVMSMGFLLREANDPVIWRGPIRANAIRQLISEVDWGRLDYMVIDLPPGTGDEALTVAQSFPAADGAIIVTTPQEASLADCRKAINFVRTVGLPVLGVIENMSGFVCPHCQHETAIFATGGGERLAEEMDVPFLGRVPLAPEVVALGDAGQPIIGATAPEAVRTAFASIVERLLAIMAEA